MWNSTDAQTVSGNGARLFPLPDDLLVCALELLGLSDLRAAAGVSRQFYAAAWRSGLYISSRKDAIMDPRDPHVIDRDAASWNALVDHALRKDLRVAFSLYGLRASSVLPADTLPLLRKLLCAITRSLPILVSLSIIVEPVAYPEVCAALQAPAPYLRSLHIRSSSLRNVALGPVSPSDGLFSGNAPLLRELGLEWRSLGPDPVPAFSNVVRLSTWHCDKDHQVPLAQHFPRLRHLMVSCSRNDVEDQVPPPQVDLCGLTLRSLVFEDTTSQYPLHVRRSLTTPTIAAFHCLVGHERRIAGSEPLGWRDGAGGTIAMHVSHPRGRAQNIRLAPSDGSWRRSYIIKEPSNRTALYSRPSVASQLGYLRLGHSSLADLVLCAAPFTALRRLRVDIVVQPHDIAFHQLDRPSVRLLSGMAPPGSAILQCPLLECVALLWQPPRPAREQPVTLDRKSVIILGLALRTNAKPALELGDLDSERPLALFKEMPDDGAAIHDVFSSVRRVGAVFDQFDGDEWNDNTALEVDRYLSQSLAW